MAACLAVDSEFLTRLHTNANPFFFLPMHSELWTRNRHLSVGSPRRAAVRHMRRLAFAAATRSSRRALTSAAEASTSAGTRSAPTDTIFALSTAPGRAGVAVIRVSGPATSDVLRLLPPATAAGGDVDTLTPAKRPKHRQALPTPFVCPDTGETLDNGILLWFDAPRSFTGEDVAELHVHGSLAVVRAVLDALGRLRPPGDLGLIRHANPGEFTRRAFRNDKLDLTQAEGLADLLDAETEAQRRQALSQSNGSLRRTYKKWRGVLLKAHAHCEATLDFGEDDELGNEVFLSVIPGVAALRMELQKHLAAPPKGELTRTGVRVSLVGPPNAGKSSLLNALAGRDVAIVSDVPGTTRDAVETNLDLNGHKVIVTDTAGVRHDVADPVEAEGIRRSKQHAEECDFVVLVVDGSAESRFQELPKWALDKAHVVVLNKADLGIEKKSEQRFENINSKQATTLRLSCTTGLGMDTFVDVLQSAVDNRVAYTAGDQGNIAAITRSRHRGRLEQCVRHLEKFDAAAKSETGRHEVAAEELRLAQRALGHVTGHVDVEELLDVIFSDFCIGK